MPERQGAREQGGGQEGPFVRPFHDQQAQQEEEADDGAHVYVAGRKGLFTPIHGSRFGDGLDGAVVDTLGFQGLIEMGILAQGIGGRPAHETRDEEGEGFVDPVAPLGGIFDVQALGGRFLIRDQVAVPAAHGFGGVFGIGEHIGTVGPDADADGRRKQQRADQEVTHPLFPEVDPELGEPEQPDQHEHVIGHLWVRAESAGGKNHGQDDA